MKNNRVLELVYIVKQCQSMAFAPTRFENFGSRVLMIYSLVFIQVFKKFQMNLCCLPLPCQAKHRIRFYLTKLNMASLYSLCDNNCYFRQL